MPSSPVLVIDDDAATLRTVGEALTPEGYDVLTASSGRLGLDIARQRRLGLILLDIGMPGMDGMAFMAEYRHEAAFQVPVVVLTGRIDDSRWQDDASILDRVTKPFDIADLVEIVGKHAAGSPSQDPADDDGADALLARIADRRDPASLAAVYEMFASQGLGLCLHILGDRMWAEDALQDAFLQVWQRARTFDQRRGSARRWIMSVIYHQAVDRLRRQHRARLAPLSWIVDASPTTADTWAEVERRLRDEHLSRALGALPPDQRLAVEMAFFGGCTHAQIADLLGIPLGTVKGRLRLAMDKLRTRLNGLGGT